HHHVSASHGPPRGELLAMQSRNEELVFWRNLPAWQLALAMPGHAAVLAGKALLRLREGQLGPWLSGRLAAWRQLPDVVRRRRMPLPAGREPSTIPMHGFGTEGDVRGCSRSLA